MPTADPTAAFRAAMQAAGLNPPEVIQPGRFVRFPGAGKGRENTASWCKLFPDGRGGIFGDHSTGLSETWQAEQEKPLTKAEQAAFRKELAEAKRQAEEARKKAQAAAAKKAGEDWKQFKPAKADHPYLVTGGVLPHGLRQNAAGKLVAPLRDAAGKMHSLQFIDKNGGGKLFLSGGRISGCYHSIGKPTSAGPLCVAEGFNTSATIHEATGYPVAVAFTAGNLRPVAEALRAKLPDVRLIICADDDATAGNPGVTKATEAAQAVGGFLAVPDFGPERPEGCTDFNDLERVRDKEEVKACIEAARPMASGGEKVAAVAQGGNPAPSGQGEAAAAHHEYGGGRFTVSDAGVFFTGFDKEGNETPPRWMCSALRVVAKTRDAASREWGRLLEWRDDDKVAHQWAMPLELLQGDGSEVRRELARMGLSLSTSKAARELLATYLQMWPVDRRARCVERPGWHGGVYVTPNEAVGGNGELVVFQSPHALAPAWSTSGDAKAWGQTVAALAAGNSRVVFVIAAAFAATLLELAREESGAFHLVGKSSCGKSTIARVAASVWGRPELYRRQWRGSTNGFEGLAALHNDGLLILDELNQADERQAGEAVYLFANGQGKQRASKTGAARSVANWRVLLLSNGEQSLSAIMARAGRRINAGQEVRLAHIGADAEAGMGSFETIHQAATPAAFAKLLDDAAAKNYGAVGLAWLRKVVADRKRLPAFIADCITKFCAAVVPPGASGQVARVARRFGLVAVAGELATEYGLTGWPEGEAATAARKCFYSWLAEFGAGDREASAILAQVRAFFEAHASSRFEATEWQTEQKVINRAGFWRDNTDGLREYLVLPETYRRELCAGFDPRQATATLRAAGWLIPSSDGRATQKPRLPGLGPTRCYVFSPAAWAGKEANEAANV